MEFNLADLWEHVVDTVPDRDAMVCGETRLTYREADARSDRLAHFLRARGIGPGDHVAIYLYNGVEYLEGMLAAFKLRGVPVNVNYRYVEEELRYLLDDADAKAVIFHREFATKLSAIRSELPQLESYVVVDDDSTSELGDLPVASYCDIMATRGAARDDSGPRSADDLYVLYTGGTTGMPKGVMWRHEDIFFGAFGGGSFAGEAITTPEAIAEKARDGRTRCLPACPFMHGTAHWMAFTTLYSGGTVVISPDRRFDAPRLWELSARESVNFLVIVGDAFARLVDALPLLDPSVDLAQLVVILSGGAILSPTVKTALAELLPGCIVIDGYGSSETGGQGQSVTVAGTEPSTAPRFRVNDETMVLDDDFHAAPVGQVGKLARRGHIPLGYYKDPDKTAATFPVIDGVRWSVPGDHARKEEDGTITLLGRGSVSINTGGEKVYPEEVEAALKAHPSVFDVIVVGVPDTRWGERVVAVVAPRPGFEIKPVDLDAQLEMRVARYKMPRDFVVVESVLRSPSGKPDYRWARTVAMEQLGISAS